MSTLKDLDFIQSIEKTIQQQLKDVVEKTPMAGRHSYFQLKYFIVNKEPTVQAKLWQCLREMKARKETLEGMELERAETTDRIGLLGIEAARLLAETPKEDDFAKQERVIKKRQAERKLNALTKSLEELSARQQDTEEEATFFLQAFRELQKIEAVKSFDDADAQKDYWTARFSNEMNMKLMMEHRIDAELAKAVLSMPDDSTVKRELIGILGQQQSLIETQRMMQKKHLELNKVQLLGENG